MTWPVWNRRDEQEEETEEKQRLPMGTSGETGNQRPLFPQFPSCSKFLRANFVICEESLAMASWRVI